MSATLTVPHTPERLLAGPGGRVLAVVTHTHPRYGGLSTAVPRLGLGVTGVSGFEVNLAAFCGPEEQFAPDGYSGSNLSFWPPSRGAWLRSGEVRTRFERAVQSAALLHIHGLWEASTATASRAALREGKPYVLSAHGMLEPWALNNKRLKKQIYAALVERKTVARAACLHALTRAEAEQYRDFGARNPIAVIPNAVELPGMRSPHEFFERYPELRGKRIVLFLGRLHAKKGLSLLAEAWASVASNHPGAHLVLAGPDSDGMEAKVRQALGTAGVEGTVTFTGMLQGDMKWSALAAAECFVLPSFSEGLSMAVLEAMGAGVPVIVTENCNMPEVTGFEAGWEIAAEAPALARALTQMLQRSGTENRATGDRGARLIAARYAPAQVARQMAEVYQFVLTGKAPGSAEWMYG